MQKRNRWQYWLIIIVLALTIYNILPTVFYYTKPLKKPISEKQANQVAVDITQRINALENESIAWVESFCKMIKVKPTSITLDKDNPAQINLLFSKLTDSDKFKKYIPRAGNLIPFMPAQLTIAPTEMNTRSKKVTLQRQIPIQFTPQKLKDFFEYTAKEQQDGSLTQKYKEIIFDRTTHISTSFAGVSENSVMVENILKDPQSALAKDMVFAIADNIASFTKVFGQTSNVTNRFFASFTQNYFDSNSKAIDTLVSAFEHFRDQIRIEKAKINKEKESQRFVSDDIKQKLYVLDKKENLLLTSENIIKKNKSRFLRGKKPQSYNEIFSTLETNYSNNSKSKIIKLNLKSNNPFISQVVLDLANDKLFLSLQKDVITFKKNLSKDKKDTFDQLIFNEIAKIASKTNEKLSLEKDEFSINLNDLENSKSLLVLKLNEVASLYVDQIKTIISDQWQTKHLELSKDSFPVYDFETYTKLPKEQKNLCLVVYSPAIHSNTFSNVMRQNSIYVVAKGLDKILQKYQNEQNSEDAQKFMKDFNNLKSLLSQNGFLGFSGAILPMSNEFSNDFIFEKDDYYEPILKASREDFKVHGSKKYANLEFTNLEQRILTINKIETGMQEELLKYRDDYNSAQVSIDPRVKYDFAPPIKNALVSNLKLSLKKYFRGDERKILHWGLDLSGGKTVQIELQDQNGKIVKDEAALKQGVNELYNRVNKMGVSEVNIRTVDSNIVLDFPGAQGLSASELVKASSMYFNVVNEKFTPNNTTLAQHVNRFLQEVYNEAVVTNKKDIDSINAIAYKHLYGESLTSDAVEPRSESAKILYENGLRLASPATRETAGTFNDSISKIAIFRGKDSKDWQQQTHPLIIVFNNYALEGTDLANIRGAYDPSKGNFLTFEVKGSHVNKQNQRINPREELYSWTSQFSKEKISGTPLETYSKGKGWRMAVVLNHSIISSPNLESALKDSAMISGSFTLREVNQLVADLKAGSLSYTPHILSEKNVSPELGKQERLKGIIAMFVALLFVITAMTVYYRFAGIVASVAVVFNLLIMWATLQNLNATLTLAGIAGIILTVGMAVDANVLVFERIKEEFKLTNRISTAVQNGYKKAFSAIFDSNITTILAALILLHFDSGPIKGFAVTLIIGIASSMFSALFMTRYFFMKWVQNPEHKTLKMSDFVKTKKFNFLKYSKFIFIASAAIILIGGLTLTNQRKSVFGMDFTGGFAINLEVEKQNTKDYRTLVENALVKAGANKQNFQIRELNPANNLRILLGTSMDIEGNPFYNMPVSLDKKDINFVYENNPRIVWIVNSLKASNISLTERSLEKLDQNWTAMSGQMSDSMKNNAILGLSLALFAILIYITFRFEFKFAMSAMICLIHDVLVTVGLVALLHFFKIPVQIDLHTIAALMTIIGYSLNDTIVIFDRIREDIKYMKKYSYIDIVNHSLNITISRTTITSATTILALIALVILGGSTIFSFALVMTIGVIFGTLSSIFIASPLMLFFNKLELKRQKIAMKKE